MKACAILFLTMLKIGIFTFGGGYAMLALLENEFVGKKEWLDSEEFIDLTTIAESTPGPIAINSATFVGFRVAGVLGSVAATLGVVLPSFIIISVIALLLNEFQHIQAVKYAFWGIRAGVLALVLKALINMYKKCKKNIMAYIVMALAFIGAAILGIHVLIIIVACAVIGLVYSLVKKGGNEQ